MCYNVGHRISRQQTDQLALKTNLAKLLCKNASFFNARSREDIYKDQNGSLSLCFRSADSHHWPLLACLAFTLNDIEIALKAHNTIIACSLIQDWQPYSPPTAQSPHRNSFAFYHNHCLHAETKCRKWAATLAHSLTVFTFLSIENSLTLDIKQGSEQSQDVVRQYNHSV